MKQYIILGSNNFWYATFSAKTLQEAEREMQAIKDSPETYPVAQPDTFYLYEVTEAGQISN